MTTDYQAPDPTIAELVYRNQSESERQHHRLQNQPSTELKTVLRNTDEPRHARANALLILLLRRDPELPAVLLELFDDPDQELWRMAKRAYRADDPRVRLRLVALLDDVDDRNWWTAALTLARSGDESLLPRLIEWLQSADRARRNVAIECLKSLRTPHAVRGLQDFWDGGQGDDEDRLVVAATLLSLGNQCGLELLTRTAESTSGAWSVVAATSIYVCLSSDGLQLMLDILDNGDLSAKQAMVNQIWNFAHLPHAFTADGLDEARVWVTSELQKESV